MLALDEQRVRLYYCIFELEGVIPWCLMHCGNIAIMLFKYTTMATTHARLRIDFDFVGISGTVSCCLWTDRGSLSSLYVGISAFSNSKVLFLGVECTMARSQLHTLVLFKYTTMATTHGSGLILILLEYLERCHVVFGRAACTFLWWCIFEFEDAFT